MLIRRKLKTLHGFPYRWFLFWSTNVNKCHFYISPKERVMRDKDQLLVHAPETVCQGREPIFFRKLNMETECNSMICNAQPAFYRFPWTPYVKMTIFILGQLFLRTYKCICCSSPPSPFIYRRLQCPLLHEGIKGTVFCIGNKQVLSSFRTCPSLFTMTSLFSTSQVHSIRFTFQINLTHTDSVSPPLVFI